MLVNHKKKISTILIVSYCKEATLWTDHDTSNWEGWVAVEFGRNIRQLPAITQADCIFKSTLVEGKSWSSNGRTDSRYEEAPFSLARSMQLFSCGKRGHKQSWIVAPDVHDWTALWRLDFHYLEYLCLQFGLDLGWQWLQLEVMIVSMISWRHIVK